MYSKEYDKNLRISQIHHKRKDVGIEKRIKKISLKALIVILIFGQGVVTIGDAGFAENNGYKLVWNDEFDGTTLNSNYWSPRYPDGNYQYSSKNVGVSNGNLVLTAIKDSYGTVKYGAAISLNKYNYKYGYIEIRGKVAKGVGLTTGLWLTGQYHYPPELDIMENIGRDPKALYLSRHCNTNYDSTCDGWNQFPTRPWWLYWTKRYVGNEDWSLGYHLYGLEWTPDYLRWIVDGVETYRVTTGVSKEPMWITLSLCGNNCLGTFDGPIDSTTVFPSRAYFDYVRVYQKATTSNSGVTVTSPNGGETLVRGSTKTISWNSTGNSGSYVKVELLKSGAVNNVISLSTPNDGKYDWSIPSIQTPGVDYKVKITSTSNQAYSDTSNNNFAISPISVVTPNGGDYWIRGTTKTIKWSYIGNPGANVKIELLKSGVLNKVISYSVLIGSYGSGSYSWHIPTTQTIGTDYKIRVTSTSNSKYTDISNNNFRIGSSFLTVSSPNGGESLKRGVANTITWKSGGIGSYVKIELLKGGVLNRVISSSTANDGSYSWTIPSTQVLGSDYKIRIISTSGTMSDTSNSYFKIY